MGKEAMDRKSINALKGIGILGILLVHYGLTTSIELVSKLVFFGARGVQLMFIINAFLIFNSLSKIELTRENIIIWWKQKFLRLIPLYWFFTILYLIVFGVKDSYYLGTLPKISVLNILANLLFLHGFHPYYINSININWFMADLAVFYVIAPFLKKKITSFEKAFIALTIVTIVGYFIEKFALHVSVIEIEAIWIDYVEIMSFPAQFPIMLMGIVAYFFYIQVLQKGKICDVKKLSFMCLFMATMLTYIHVMNEEEFTVFNTIFSSGIIFLFLFIGQMIYPWKIVGNNILAFIGKHSYGVYLSHRIVIKFLNTYSIKGDADKVYVRVIGFCILVLLSLMISVLAEQLIEKLLCKKILKLYAVR